MTESLLLLLLFPPHLQSDSLKCPKPVLQVIKNSKTNMAELELFPRYLLFLRQQPATRTQQSNVWVNMGMMSLRMFPQHLPRGNLRMQQESPPPVQFPGQPRLGELPVLCLCSSSIALRHNRRSAASRAFLPLSPPRKRQQGAFPGLSLPSPQGNRQQGAFAEKWVGLRSEKWALQKLNWSKDQSWALPFWEWFLQPWKRCLCASLTVQWHNKFN